MRHNIYFIAVFTLLMTPIVSGQESFFHPELNWQTIETKHFLVHFHEGTERTAQEIAKIAESVYDPITKMYGHEPDERISFVVRDHDDYSNGGAYFYDNKIEIWAPALDYEFRGTHPWLWNVVTHEFTHIIQIQTTMKFGRKFPGIYFQWLGYEEERRPDVLYGYPNVLVSYPISGFVVPMWFAEGVAQYNNPAFKYDYWDSHRDMILRMRMLDSIPLSWNEMGSFGKNSLGNESVYNSGFSLVEYIAQKYGVDKLQAISHKLSATFCVKIDGVIEDVIGKSGEILYEEWKSEKLAQYKSLSDSINLTRREGEIIEKEGFGNYYPVFSPDNSKIAYISNKEQDYLSLSSVYLYDCAAKTSKMIIGKVRSSLSFSPDGKYIYYAQITNNNPHWSGYSDLHRFDIGTEKEERLTHGLRAFNPKISPDGKKLVYAVGGSGTLNIGVCDADGKSIDTLTHFQNGEQVYTPVWSKDGQKISFGYSAGHNQSVALIDTNGSGFKILPHEGDCRDPYFASDSTLVYSWDRGGIFNIYELNMKTRNERQITNVTGAAFLPTANSNGDIAYANYTSSGYKIAVLNKDSIIAAVPVEKDSPAENIKFRPPYNGLLKMDISDAGLPAKSENIPPENGSVLSVKVYRSAFTNISLIPMLRIDNYNESSKGLDVVKPGMYISSTEVLDKINIFGGAVINRKLERDLFLIIEYRDRLPIFYQLGLEPIASIELYNITRKRDRVSFNLFVDRLYTIYTDVTYNLSEFDFSLTQHVFSELCKLKLMYSLSSYSSDIGTWMHPNPTFGVISASGSTYFIGNTFSAQFKYIGILPTVDKDINPVGRSFFLKYFYDINKFNPRDSIEIKNGMAVPIYTHYNINRLELNWNEHIALPFPRHTLSFTINAAGVLGKTVDEFFDYYAGGFIGMRGYPFYAIGGNRTVSLNTTYRFPIVTQMNFSFLQFYFTKLYGSIFCDIGNAWPRETVDNSFWKRDVGFELRLESFSFYAYPTRIFFSGAYGLDKFKRKVNDVNVGNVIYGQEWRFYLGVLFGFELGDIIPRQLTR